MLELKGAGLPNSGRPSAIFSQSFQPSLSALVKCGGALVIEPRLEASVMEPFCKKTRSSAPTATVSVSPPLFLRLSPVTRTFPPSSASCISVTCVPPTNCTP